MTRRAGIVDVARRIASGLAWVGRALFEPSRFVTGVVERRRARMLPKLQLAHAAQLLLSVNVVAHAEKGATAIILPKIFLVTCGCILVCYALSRTRQVRLSVWGYAVIGLAFSPISLVLTAPTTGFSPLMLTIFLIPPALLINAFVSARAALIAGLLGLMPMWLALRPFGNPAWVDPLVAGSTAYLTFLILIVIFGVYRDRIETDRVTELRARNQELEQLRLTLDDKVKARTHELSARNVAMRLVLDNISQGMFTVDPSGAMSAEHSAALNDWFGPVHPGESFFRYFGRRSEAFAVEAEMGWDQVMANILPPELALEQLPCALQVGSRSFRLSYQWIDADAAGRVLMVLSDVTAEVERERAELEKKETFKVFEHVLGDRRGFLSFMQEASGLMDRVRRPGGETSEITRALHTLKGNSMLFGIHTVARMCHELESSMEGGKPADEKQLAALFERWQRLSEDMGKLLGGREDHIEVSTETFAALQRAAHGCGPREEVARLIDDLAFEPVHHRLAHFADHARRLAQQLEKRVEVDVTHDGSHLDERPWPVLWAVFVHAVRNAIDHGIESEGERKAAGKPEVGHIALRARREGMDIVLEIEDDGRGVDWQAIRRKCEVMNLPAGSQEELLEGLFAEGMSTADAVTEISGRGVGMGALRAAVQGLDGTLFIGSEPGQSTLVRMIFRPPAAVASLAVTQAGKPFFTRRPAGAIS